MVDSRITAMVVAVLSGFEKGLTVNINVCSKEGESASIAIGEFTKDEASKLLLDALQKNTANKSISFAVTGSKADNKAEEQEESKQVYDLDTPFAEKIPENAEFAWAELVDAFLSMGVEFTKQIYNFPTYHKYGECKFAQNLDLKLATKEFLAQKNKARAVFVEYNIVHLFDEVYPAFHEYIKYVSRSIKSVLKVYGFDEINKQTTLAELAKIFSSTKYQKINLRGRRPK